MRNDDATNETVKRGFWDTTMGTVTKITAFITALTALIVAIKPWVSDSNQSTNAKPVVENTDPHKEFVVDTAKPTPESYVPTEADIAAFLNAAKTGDVAAMRLQLDAGIDPDINVTGDPTTALVYAIDNHKPEAVTLLLDHNANPDSKIRGVSYPIIEASFWGDAEIVGSLIRHKANLNIRKLDGSQITPLMFASIRGFKDVVQKLIDAGAEVNLKASNNATALDFAHASTSADKAQIIAMLLAVGSISGIGP